MAEEDEAAADQGVICLCIPRAYLQQKKGPQEDLCAKYGATDECPEENGNPAPEEEKRTSTVES